MGVLCDQDGHAFLMHMFLINFAHNSQVVDFLKANDPGREWWPKVQKTTWNSFVKPRYAETLTRRGFGYTFNLIEEEKLLNFTK